MLLKRKVVNRWQVVTGRRQSRSPRGWDGRALLERPRHSEFAGSLPAELSL